MNIVNNSNKISTLIILQNNTDVISRLGCNVQVHVYRTTNVSVDVHFEQYYNV